MHFKRAYLPGDHDGEPLLHLIRPGEMVKTSALAPASEKFISSLRPDPRYTYVLSNAMGNSKVFGANSNTDWYGYNPNLDFDGLVHAWEGIGNDIETDRMKGKGWPYGYPCFYGATVYAHHKNHDPQQLGFGDVICCVYNSEMQRVELVLRVFNKEAQEKGHSSILDRIRAGERVDTSMGCKVPFDLCSICTDWEAIKTAWKGFDPARHAHPGIAILEFHKKREKIRGLAITKADYCSCMVNARGRVYPDGRKVFVYNDFPRFFDESFVWIGADRTARVMWHLPSGDAIPIKHRVGTVADLLESISSKTASIEKEIPGGTAEAALHDADVAPEMLETRILIGMRDPQVIDIKRVLAALAGLGILPTPREFQSLVLRTPEGQKLSGVSWELFDDRVGGVDDTFAIGARHFDAKLAQAFLPFAAHRSSFAPFLEPRMASTTKRASIRMLPTPKALTKIGQMYNGFRLSVLREAPQLLPKVASFLDTDHVVAAQDHADLGGFLLGDAPVIQLISAHLQRSGDDGAKIAAMARLTSTSNTLEKVSRLGTVLREIVGLDNDLGMMKALATLGAQAGKLD